MRLSHLVILLLLCALGFGYYKYNELEKKIAELQKPPPPPPSPAAEVANNRHICPCCNGEGRIAARSSAGSSSSVRRMAGSSDRMQYYNCPCCGGSGYRCVDIPADAHLCPDCGGMGKVLTGAGKQYGVVCKRCNGCGYVLPRHKIL